jgi:hypothetical protein
MIRTFKASETLLSMILRYSVSDKSMYKAIRRHVSTLILIPTWEPQVWSKNWWKFCTSFKTSNDCPSVIFFMFAATDDSWGREALLLTLRGNMKSPMNFGWAARGRMRIRAVLKFISVNLFERLAKLKSYLPLALAHKNREVPFPAIYPWICKCGKSR